METEPSSLASTAATAATHAGVGHRRFGQVGSFRFDGAEVEVFLSEDGRWHLRSEGCEVADKHLGTATRTLFNPDNSPSTRQLIQEILAWEGSDGDADAGVDRDGAPERDGDWLTAPRPNRDAAS